MNKYEGQWVNINATDCPLIITNTTTQISKHYGVEGLPWNLVSGKVKNQEILEYVFNNFESDISPNKSEFEYLKDALKDNFKVKERLKHVKLHGKEILVTPYIENNNISLQFHGWEIVLFQDGSYYMNDTSGG